MPTQRSAVAQVRCEKLHSAMVNDLPVDVPQPVVKRFSKRCPHGKRKHNCATCWPCPHGKRKGNCGVCASCPHGKLKHHCATCAPCPHNKMKSGCGRCSRPTRCPHGKRRSSCAACSGCPHGKRKSNCGVCSGCQHGKRKNQCGTCNQHLCNVEGCPVFGHRFSTATRLLTHMRSQHSGNPKALTKQKELVLYQQLQ